LLFYICDLADVILKLLKSYFYNNLL